MEKAIINKIIEINECCLPIARLILKNNTLGAYSTEELLLMEIYSRNVCSASSFAKKFGFSRSYVGRMIRQHENNSLISRTRSQDDERVLMLTLTPKGKTYTESIIKKNNSELCEKLSLLSDSEQKELVEAFCIITNILK
ncbi:MAG: MarR family transcriptional regulator [Clostridia bacterium]|nr:MarR family transcriptional regulator [Clostridia bacterium]